MLLNVLTKVFGNLHTHIFWTLATQRSLSFPQLCDLRANTRGWQKGAQLHSNIKNTSICEKIAPTRTLHQRSVCLNVLLNIKRIMITRKIIFQGLEKGVLRHFATAFPFLTKRFQVQRKNISPSLSENFLCQKIEQKRSNSSSFRNSIMAQSSTAKTSHNSTSAIEFLQIVTKLKVKSNLSLWRVYCRFCCKFIKWFSVHVFGNILEWFTLKSFQEQKRTGWVIKNVKNPESIADHMYRMSIMALIAVDSAEINKDRSVEKDAHLNCKMKWIFLLSPLLVFFSCIKIALVHDIAEGTSFLNLFLFSFGLVHLYFCLFEQL